MVNVVPWDVPVDGPRLKRVPDSTEYYASAQDPEASGERGQ